MQFLISLGYINYIVILKKRGIDYLNLPYSKATICSTYEQRVYCTKNRYYYLLCKELLLGSLQKLRVHGNVKMFIIRNLYVFLTITTNLKLSISYQK